MNQRISNIDNLSFFTTALYRLRMSEQNLCLHFLLVFLNRSLITSYSSVIHHSSFSFSYQTNQLAHPSSLIYLSAHSHHHHFRKTNFRRNPISLHHLTLSFFLFRPESILNSSHFKACRLSPRDTFQTQRQIPPIIFQPRILNLTLADLPAEIFEFDLDSRGNFDKRYSEQDHFRGLKFI